MDDGPYTNLALSVLARAKRDSRLMSQGTSQIVNDFDEEYSQGRAMKNISPLDVAVWVSNWITENGVKESCLSVREWEGK